jgi:hypothetical protein
MSARRLPSLLPALLFAAPLSAQAPPAREDLDALGAAIETAVSRVSRPSRGVVGARAPRSYRLPGYGAMILLSPRPLPTATRPGAEPQGARALAEVARAIEQSLRTVQSEEARQQLQRQLTALREAEASLRQRAAQPAAAPVASATPAAPARDIATLERQMEEELARQADELQRSEGSRGEMDAAALAELDSQLRIMHEQAEAFRQEAERVLHAAEREVQQRLATPGTAATTGAAVPRPEPPVLSPWQTWFGMEEPAQTPGSPEEAIEAVRSAILSVLETPGQSLRALGPDEAVVVAVDFVPQTRMSFRPAAQKTLVVRASRKTIEARREGRLSSAEFRKRVEVVEN